MRCLLILTAARAICDGICLLIWAKLSELLELLLLNKPYGFSPTHTQICQTEARHLVSFQLHSLISRTGRWNLIAHQHDLPFRTSNPTSTTRKVSQAPARPSVKELAILLWAQKFKRAHLLVPDEGNPAFSISRRTPGTVQYRNKERWDTDSLKISGILRACLSTHHKFSQAQP